MLEDRIRRLEANSQISNDIAERLVALNQADQMGRKCVIWFCFFHPRFAGESGVGDLLRNWGGEALYNSHEADESIGPVLRSIGTPCVVEADIPIAYCKSQHSLAENMGRRFCVNRGLQSVEPIDHEDRTTQPISRDKIKRIIIGGEPEFIAVTGCDEWDLPLT